MGNTKRQQRRHPTLLAVVMVLVGSWAAMATSPPSSSAEASGTVTVSPQHPAARISVTSDGGPELSNPDLSVKWSASSESGVVPVLSVTSLGSDPMMSYGAPVSAVDVNARNADLELTVRNIDETGTVTIDWQATTFMEGSDLDLSVAATVSAGQPSSTVTLPVVRAPFSRLRVPFKVFVVEARYESSATVTITRTDQNREAGVEVDAIVGENLLAVEPGTTRLPTERAECIDGRCVLTFMLSVVETPTLQVEVSDGEGSVTAVAREPATDVAWVKVSPLSLLSEITDLSINVEMPDDPRNPFADRAILVVRMSDDSDPINDDLDCFAPLEYAFSGQPFAELVSFASNETGGRPLTLLNGATATIDLRIGTTDPGQYCDVDSDNETELEIGVMTIGVSDALPAKVSLK